SAIVTTLRSAASRTTVTSRSGPSGFGAGKGSGRNGGSAVAVAAGSRPAAGAELAQPSPRQSSASGRHRILRGLCGRMGESGLADDAAGVRERVDEFEGQQLPRPVLAHEGG